MRHDCASFLDSIKNDRPLYLIGHSLGGSIVPIVAADKPKLITGIIILAGAVDPAMEPEEGWRETFTKVPIRYLMPSAFRASNDELWYFKKDVVLIGDKLKQVRCKVYIVHAVNDQLVDVRNVDYMKRMMTSAQVDATILPEGNHFIPWNHEDFIIKLLMRL
jgi:pimeloyl-ACP methyl ester carboxylesterase